MWTSLFSAAVHRSVLGMLPAYSSQRFLLNVKTTTGRSSFLRRRPMRWIHKLASRPWAFERLSAPVPARRCAAMAPRAATCRAACPPPRLLPLEAAAPPRPPPAAPPRPPPPGAPGAGKPAASRSLSCLRRLASLASLWPLPRKAPLASTTLCSSLPAYRKCSSGTGRFGVEMTKMSFFLVRLRARATGQREAFGEGESGRGGRTRPSRQTPSCWGPSPRGG